MPNWCHNKLTIRGPEADVQSFKAKALGHSPWEEPEGESDVLNFHSLVRENLILQSDTVCLFLGLLGSKSV